MSAYPPCLVNRRWVRQVSDVLAWLEEEELGDHTMAFKEHSPFGRGGGGGGREGVSSPLARAAGRENRRALSPAWRRCERRLFTPAEV